MNDLFPKAELSIVLPAYSEAAGIAEAIRVIEHSLTGHIEEYEIIVVDDGSPDDTYARVSEVSERNMRVRGVRLSRNFGKEAALLAGLRAAEGRAVITMDADLQHPPDLIPEMLRAWRAGAIIVNGVKRDRSNDGFVVRARAALANALISRLGNIDLQNASDFKLLDRTAVDVIITWLPEKMRFYRGLTQWIGFSQVDVPFDVRPRGTGTSSFSLRSLAKLTVNALVSFTSAPLRAITVLGFITMLTGGAIGAEALWSWWRGSSVSGFTTIILTVLLLGSATMISLGIVGEYIARIYDEIKARPSYLVSSACGFRTRKNVGEPWTRHASADGHVGFPKTDSRDRRRNRNQ